VTDAPHDLLIRARAAANAALEHPASGRAAAEVVAEDARRGGDAEALVIALRAAGWAARELYDHDAAERFIAEAVHVAREHRLESRLSDVLVTRSSIRLEEGMFDLARADLVEARELASPDSRAEVVFAEALLESRAGNLRAAALAYEAAVDAAGRDRPDLAAKAYNNWSQVCRNLGDLDQAHDKLLQVVNLARGFSPMLVAIATHNLAGVSGDAGRAVDALRLYDEALTLLEAAGEGGQPHPSLGVVVLSQQMSS
jgi:tetratricopeptide (TPR) repeat protein